MQCTNCGAQNAGGNQFCRVCGAPLGPQTVQPEPAAIQHPAQPPAQAPAQPPVQPAVPTKKRGCWLWAIGCLVVLVLFACVGLVFAGWYFRWPMQLGLVESPGESLFEPSPDPYAAEAIIVELADSGINVKGLSVYVIPTEQGEMIAYLLAEETDGFVWDGPTFDNAIEGLLMFTAASEVASELEIDRVAVDYRGPEGEQIAVMTAPVDALVAVALGEITQDELFDQMNGRAGGGSSISLGGE